jgi:hypothetical protein
MIKFAIYSIDIAATLNPWDANPQPATFIDLGEEPLFGTYDMEAGTKGRGCRIQTLGSVFDQDFGVQEEDAAITLALPDIPFTTSQAAALEVAFAAVDINYYFTDSVNCWMVKFVKPDGLKLRRNMFWKAQNEDAFSVNIGLKVNSKSI